MLSKIECISTINKTKKLYKESILKSIYIIPPFLGGNDIPNNKLYVPYDIATKKNKCDEYILMLYDQNIINMYSCNPIFNGDSSVPSQLYIMAQKDGLTVYYKKIDIY